MQTAAMPNLRHELLKQLKTMPHECTSYSQSFFTLRCWLPQGKLYDTYEMVNRDNKKLSHTHFYRHHGSRSLEIGAIIPGPEDGIVGKQILCFGNELRLMPVRTNCLILFQSLIVLTTLYTTNSSCVMPQTDVVFAGYVKYLHRAEVSGGRCLQ